MVKNLHAPMNAFAFGQYAPTKCDWTIADRGVAVPEHIT